MPRTQQTRKVMGIHKIVFEGNMPNLQGSRDLDNIDEWKRGLKSYLKESLLIS